MENISAVDQTLNSSEFQSVLGAGGHLALNVISMLLLGLPMVLSNGFVIIVLLMDKTTISALRIALINILAAVMTTGLTFILWVIAHIARRAGLASDQSLVLAIRIAAGFFQASFFLRTFHCSKCSSRCGLCCCQERTSKEEWYVVSFSCSSWDISISCDLWFLRSF